MSLWRIRTKTKNYYLRCVSYVFIPPINYLHYKQQLMQTMFRRFVYFQQHNDTIWLVRIFGGFCLIILKCVGLKFSFCSCSVLRKKNKDTLVFLIRFLTVFTIYSIIKKLSVLFSILSGAENKTKQTNKVNTNSSEIFLFIINCH